MDSVEDEQRRGRPAGRRLVMLVLVLVEVEEEEEEERPNCLRPEKLLTFTTAPTLCRLQQLWQSTNLPANRRLFSTKDALDHDEEEDLIETIISALLLDIRDKWVSELGHKAA